MMTGWTQKNLPGPPISLIYFLLYYHLWTRRIAYFTHAAKEIVGHALSVPDEGSGNFEQYPAGGTTSVYFKVDTTKLVYLTFDPVVISTINWRLTVISGLEHIRVSRGDPISYPRNNPTGSSTIPISEESWKSLTCTPRLGESQPTKGPKRMTQPDRSDVNL